MKTYYLLPLCIQAGSARLYSILGVDTSDRNHINTSKAFASPAKLNAHLQAAIGEKISNKLPKIAENLNKCAMCDVIGEIALTEEQLRKLDLRHRTSATPY